MLKETEQKLLKIKNQAQLNHIKYQQRIAKWKKRWKITKISFISIILITLFIFPRIAATYIIYLLDNFAQPIYENIKNM